MTGAKRLGVDRVKRHSAPVARGLCSRILVKVHALYKYLHLIA